MADTSQTSEKGTRITYRCSFCGKDQQQVRRLIAGPGGVYICNECVALCQEIINEEAVASDQQTSSGNWVTTTRSQTSVSGKDESAAPTPTPCPECQSQRMLATLVPGLRVAAPEDLLPGIMGRWSQIQAVVCPSCGYTTFYAKNPDKLAK